MSSRDDEHAPGGRDLATREASPLAAPPSPTALALDLEGQQRLLELSDTPEVIVGRAPEVTVCVDDERVSRRHLRLRLRDGVISAEDLGSRNGTTLNGVRLQGERRVRGGDELVVGPLRVLVGGPRRPETLLGEGDLLDRLDEELERARAFKRPLALIGLRLRGTPAARDVAAARLAGRVARTEVLGEDSAGRLLVLLPERTRADASARAAELARAAQEIAGLSVAATPVAYPDDGRSVDELIAAAWPDSAPAAAPQAARWVVEEAATRALLETARRAARSTATVLITGETGAGKDWVASEIHAASARAAGPFIALNCAALPENLLESELFGHERGAFTGADRRRHGRLEDASGGTLFLDELGEMPLPMQAKLLRALEHKRITRVGGNEEIAVDVRFVAATNRDLEVEVRAGRFREDLFFRLSSITLHVPPLRERPADLRALITLLVDSLSTAQGRRPPRRSPGFDAALESYPWPGNVRELRNVIERALVLGEGDELTTRELPERLQRIAPPAPEGPMKRKLDDVERGSVEQALADAQGNRTHAARRLGISRRALIYKLHKYGLIDRT